MSPSEELRHLIRESAVIVCCGSGGVGKTTTSAALAVQGALEGRRTVVVTIDPARRLADALGISGIGNTPTRIEGHWPGEMWAVMLDTKGTFDDLVIRHAADAAQAERILGSVFYRNISGTLSGTQEYMAAEKLYELHDEGAFDLVIVDTPPTRNALDFLTAPERLTHFLDHRLYRVIVSPNRGVLKAVNIAAQSLLRRMTRVVGAAVIDDAITFFQAFAGMDEGFRDRADAVDQLLTSEATAFLLVTSPRPDAVSEAHFFAARLTEQDIAVRAIIVNRVHADLTASPLEELRSRAAALDKTALADWYTALADHQTLAEAERTELAELALETAPAPLALIPHLLTDIHDLDGLERVRYQLLDADPADNHAQDRPQDRPPNRKR